MKRLLILLFVLLFATSAFATTDRIRYVDTDVVGGASDGTTWTNAYASMLLAEDGEDATGDITAATGSDENVIFYCRGTTAETYSGSSSYLLFTGWATGAGNEIYVIGNRDNRSGYQTDTYRIEYTTDAHSRHAVTTNSNRITLSNFQTKITAGIVSGGTNSAISGGPGGAGNLKTYRNLYIEINQVNTTAVYGIFMYNGDSNMLAERVHVSVNSAATSTAAFAVQGNGTSTGTFVAYNCSYSRNGNGTGGNGIICTDVGYTSVATYNCSFDVSPGNDPYSTSVCTFSGSHNAISAASDAQAPATGLVVSIGSADARTEPKLRDMGLHTNWISRTKDDSGYPLNISHIYNGTVDIGAYEFFPRGHCSQYNPYIYW